MRLTSSRANVAPVQGVSQAGWADQTVDLVPFERNRQKDTLGVIQSGCLRDQPVGSMTEPLESLWLEGKTP
jgi:hypothetical protein